MDFVSIISMFKLFPTHFSTARALNKEDRKNGCLEMDEINVIQMHVDYSV